MQQHPIGTNLLGKCNEPKKIFKWLVNSGKSTGNPVQTRTRLYGIARGRDFRGFILILKNRL
jgi:hypothetical protein